MPATAHLHAAQFLGEDPHRPPDRHRWLQDLLGAEQDRLVTQAQIEAHGIANAASLRTHLHRAARLRVPRPVLTTRRGPRGSLWLLPGVQGPRRGQLTLVQPSGDPGAVQVPLAGGQTALVDAQDADLVAPHLWYAQKSHARVFYAVTADALRMHRLVATAALGPAPTPKHTVDHISGDGLDNRRANLRWSTPAAQKWTPRRYKNNSTGARGVSVTPSGRFVARLQAHGVSYHLGTHDTIEDAQEAIEAARDRYWR